MFSAISTHYNYAVVIVLMMVGLYIVFAASNLVKKLVGLSVFQTSVFLLYITLSKVSGGVPPILPYKGTAEGTIYSNPLPHVLILTAIVVGVATLSVGLALVVRLREVYGTIEEDEINEIDYRFDLEGTAD